MREKPGAVSRPIAVFLLTYCLTFLAVYLMVPNPLVFQTMYGIVVVAMILQALWTLQRQHSYQVVSLYVASVLFYLAGFILWNLGRVNRKIKNFGDFKLQKTNNEKFI